MNPLPALLFTLLACCVVLSAEVPALPAIPLASALSRSDLDCSWSGNGRDQLTLTVRNSSSTNADISIPAGLISASRGGREKVVVLRSAQLSVPAAGSSEVLLPAAALSMKNAFAPSAFVPTSETEPQLAGLLKGLAAQPDAPKATAQLAVLCLLENITFVQWQQFLAAQRSAEKPPLAQPTPAGVAQAIDALGLLRSLDRKRDFALASDSGLKLLALRNPWCRAKAMQLYGLDAGDGAIPPDLGQLLHTKPGDNCPVCRLRTEMQAPKSDL